MCCSVFLSIESTFSKSWKSNVIDFMLGLQSNSYLRKYNIKKQHSYKTNKSFSSILNGEIHYEKNFRYVSFPFEKAERQSAEQPSKRIEIKRERERERGGGKGKEKKRNKREEIRKTIHQSNAGSGDDRFLVSFRLEKLRSTLGSTWSLISHDNPREIIQRRKQVIMAVRDGSVKTIAFIWHVCAIYAYDSLRVCLWLHLCVFVFIFYWKEVDTKRSFI